MKWIQITVIRDGQEVEVGALEFLRICAVGLLSFLVSFPRHLLEEAVHLFDKLLMSLCNAIGRAGMPEIGGGLLSLRHWRRQFTWLPEGEDPELIKAIEKHTGRPQPHLRKPHFQVFFSFRDD